MSTNISAPPHGRILGIFAKEPRLGFVKTRLAQATSLEWACQVAAAFLNDSLDRLASIEATRAIVYAPLSATDYFHKVADGRFDLIAQSDGDLGQRLQSFFTNARQQGFSRIIALGSDSPTLPTEHVEQAFQLLEKSDVTVNLPSPPVLRGRGVEGEGVEPPAARPLIPGPSPLSTGERGERIQNDIVVGPAFDGGYYLIGCGLKELPIFDEIPWSTSRVLETTLARLQGTSATLALLPPWYDVDTMDDWHMLRGHVRAMRHSGIDPGVPRVERLIEEQNS